MCNRLKNLTLPKIKKNNNTHSIQKKMSFQNPFSLISLDRNDFVFKTNTETYSNVASIAGDIYNNDSSNTSSYREICKATFLSLVAENEKEYCKKKYIYEFELENVIYKWGQPRECNNYKLTRYS